MNIPGIPDTWKFSFKNYGYQEMKRKIKNDNNLKNQTVKSDTSQAIIDKL